jgi:hypothetical protein
MTATEAVVSDGEGRISGDLSTYQAWVTSGRAEFAPAKHYILRGIFQGISFVLDIVDVTTGQEVVAAQFKLKAMPDRAQPVVVPVLVPTK